MRRLSILLACVVMALTLIAIAVATGASAATQQQPQQQTKKFYGAFDWSKAKGVLYWGTGTSKASVNRDAYNECHKSGATDCVTVVWVYNGWIAVAHNSKAKIIGVGWGATKQAASNAAVKRCGAGCKVIGWRKTAIDPNKQTTGGYTLPGP
jgi:hypothetical protein